MAADAYGLNVCELFATGKAPDAMPNHRRSIPWS